MVPLTLVGLGLWLVALVVVLVRGASPDARDITLAGIVLGVLLLAWAVRMDRRLDRTPPQASKTRDVMT